jgi:hypothetical protein
MFYYVFFSGSGPSQESNMIFMWQLELVGHGPCWRVCYQTHSHLGLVRLVEATKQVALHQLGQALAGLGPEKARDWFPSLQLSPPGLAEFRAQGLCLDGNMHVSCSN